MTKFKRLMALAAVSMLGVQLIGAGTAFAASTSDCDFGSDNLEITLDTDNVELWLDEDGLLQCDPGGGDDDSQAVGTIDSITVEMDDDDSTGTLTIYLDDDSTGGTTYASAWPEFDTFDIDVTTTLYIDGSYVDDAAGNSLDIMFGKSTFSFSGTSGTYVAPKLDIQGGDDKDEIDASKATVRVVADGNGEDDVIKGGSANDVIDDSTSDDGDIAYGNGGNDVVSVTGALSQAWGGDGHDDLAGAIVAPGAGNDDVDADTLVTYADLTDGIEYIDGDTAGAAGDDDLSGTFARISGSQGDDVIVGTFDRISGNAGDDVIKCDGCDGGTHYAAGGAGDDFIAEYGTGVDNVFYGNAGNDVLRGKDGDDELRGGPGSDQAWGANGSADLCTAEVLNRCELIKN
ncbi:MAG: calcium-binding protein [Actinomycetota bacterium]